MISRTESQKPLAFWVATTEANWFLAANHSRTFLPPFSKFRIARYISLVAASSVGNEPHVLIDLRITRFRLSIAFVVYMILQIAGSKAKNGITSYHARRQAGTMEAYFPAHFSSNASSGIANSLWCDIQSACLFMAPPGDMKTVGWQ